VNLAKEYTGDPLVRTFRRARWRAGDFEASGCAHALQRALERAADYAPPEPLAELAAAYRECETALLYWTGPYVLGREGRWDTANPLDDVLEHLTAQRDGRARPLSALELRVAMRRAARYLLGALLRRCDAIRRMDDDDPLTATYRKLIATRTAWMPN
jgi:hypothetical protein